MRQPGDDGDCDPNSGVTVHVPWRDIVEECDRVEDFMVGGWNDCTQDRLVSPNPTFGPRWYPRKKAVDHE